MGKNGPKVALMVVAVGEGGEAFLYDTVLIRGGGGLVILPCDSLSHALRNRDLRTC